jgi:hypothetical protein
VKIEDALLPCHDVSIFEHTGNRYIFIALINASAIPTRQTFSPDFYYQPYLKNGAVNQC